jgi:D-alanyl-D-alanine carboxypeptidase/D-alanyl-D-alanine-endopeptidase (penicillin-binding protein 4)
LNNNLANISISKNDNGSISVKAPSEYQFPIINTLKAGETNNIYAIRQEWIYPDVVCLKGSIASNATISVPINNMKKYYQKVVLKTMKDVGINTVQKMCFDSNIPQNAKKITTIKHPILPLMDKILKNSNNMYAETLTKLAGGVKYNSTASISLQRKLFYDYWQNKNVDLSDINVVDGSGVSRNNLVTVDFMTEALNKLYQDKGENFMKSYLAQPGEGTLSSRLLNYRGAVYLKTGTLSNVSGLCGYVVSDSGKTYSVAILIQNFMYPTKDVKLFENKLIEEIKKM